MDCRIFNMCTQMLMYVIANEDIWTHVRESALKVDSGRKISLPHWGIKPASAARQSDALPMSYIPTHIFSHTRESCEKNWIIVFKVIVTVKLQNVDLFTIILSLSVKTALLSSKSKWRLLMVKLWLSTLSSELLLLQPNLVWQHKLDCLLKRLDCFVMFKVKVTAKIIECSSA